MVGRIVKGISGFYYVFVAGSGIYECKAKGAFRKQGMKPLVGDHVEIEVLDEAAHLGNVEKILPRQNALIRPAVANIDQALVIFAAASPEPNLNLLDRFLIMMAHQDVPVEICFNKSDLVDEAKQDSLRSAYECAGYNVYFTEARAGIGRDEVMRVLAGKTTTVAGPSGVGKSTLINSLQDAITMETGAISEKIGRGRHTTRHSELIPIAPDTFIMDTPGFSSLYVPEVAPEELWEYFPEFVQFEPECRFIGCRHLSEPDCGVKEALSHGEIAMSRYENYKQIYEELEAARKY